MPHRFPDGLPALQPMTIARLERRLPAPGELRVSIGSRVEPDDLIGQCSVQGEPVLLDVASTLQIPPGQLERHMERKAGQWFGFRDVLVRYRGRTILAPFVGTVTDVDASTGFVILTPEPMPASVSASLRGDVVDVQPNRAATIETAAAVVQGAVGFGGEQWGVLRLLVTDPGDTLVADAIDARSAFTIVIGGAGITADALRKAQQEQIKGVILGSIDADELRDFWGPRFHGNWLHLLRTGAGVPLPEDSPTIFLTEGFGGHPMSRPIFDLLTQFDRQEAYLDGITRLGTPQRRPRLIIPMQRALGAAPPAPAQPLRPGVIVRLLDEGHFGQVGRVESLNPHGRLPSGLRAATATVHLANGARVVLPELALEVFE